MGFKVFIEGAIVKNNNEHAFSTCLFVSQTNHGRIQTRLFYTTTIFIRNGLKSNLVTC